MQIKCPLCDNDQIVNHDKKVDHHCKVCGNIFTDKQDTQLVLLQINLLKFKHRESFCLQFIQAKAGILIASIMRLKHLSFLVIMILSVCFMILSIVVNVVPFYHKGDVQIFHVWADCFEKSGRDIYLNCKYTPNYPTVGLFASAGIMHIIKSLTSLTNLELIDNIFRSCLFAFDILNFFLFSFIARMMEFRRPFLIGLLLFVIPSNLFGGAIWGQIDNIALTFCLITSIAFVKSWPTKSYLIKKIECKKRKLIKLGWLTIALASLSIFILIKQLSAFSIPYFLVLFTVTSIKFWQNWKYKGLLLIGLSLLVFATIFYCLDHILAVPDKFFGSSYYYVWTGGGSEHGNIISANGFNVWILLGRNPSSSSHIPFVLLGNTDTEFSMSPYELGISFFLLWSLFLLVTTLFVVIKFLQKKQINPIKLHPKLIVVLFWYHGLTHLGFNILLTGTHERYLYIGYPFILLSGMYFFTHKKMLSWRLTFLCFASAFIYGCFVFSVIAPLPGLFFAFSRHEFMATLHLFLLILLGDAWLHISKKLIA